MYWVPKSPTLRRGGASSLGAFAGSTHSCDARTTRAALLRMMTTAASATSFPWIPSTSTWASRTLRGFSSHSEFSQVKTGAGFGNVRDRVIAGRRARYRHTSDPHTCTLIGAPMTYGQPFAGTDGGPRMLREAGLRGMLAALGWRVEDLPDLDFEAIAAAAQQQVRGSRRSSEDDEDGASNCFAGHARNPELVGPGAKALADLVQEKLGQGRFPLVLGGDHSIGIGSLAGILRARPQTGVIWVDAHADLNTPGTSESGNLHGMPVGLLMEGAEAESESLPGFDWLRGVPRLSPESVVYVGLRDVDPAEREAIHSRGIAAYTMHEIDQHGIGAVMEAALNHLQSKDPHRPLHLSYDIDAVDPVLAPATGTTVRGGLTFREAHYVAEAVALTGNLASADIVELNPSLTPGDGAEATVELGLQIITSFMGKSII